MMRCIMCCGEIIENSYVINGKHYCSVICISDMMQRLNTEIESLNKCCKNLSNELTDVKDTCIRVLKYIDKSRQLLKIETGGD